MPKSVNFAPQVANFITTISPLSAKKLRRLLSVLSEVGFLTFPHARKIAGHGNLFEIRILTQGNERVFYAYATGDNIWLLHAFAKRSQTTPTAEIEKALTARRLFIGE